MKKYIKYILITILILLIACSLSFYAGYKYNTPKTKVTISKSKIKQNTIKRTYKKVDIIKELSRYDTDPFLLDIQYIENDDYRLTGQLYRRQAERDIKIKVHEDSNWKFYLGCGLGAGVIVGGVVLYKVLK